MKTRISSVLAGFAAALLFAILVPAVARAQEAPESNPVDALTSAFVAACRANESQLANYLTADNAVAFRALPEDQRKTLLKRISLADDPGKPLISSDAQNHTVLRCEAPGGTVEFRFGDARVRENLAFIPITAAGRPPTDFGMVREKGSWKLLSLGLVLFDIPQLSKEWVEQDLAAREDAIIADLRGMADAVQTYRRAFGKLPDSLAQLGPAPPDGVSPEQANLVNEHLAAGSQGGYQFRYRIVSAANDSDSKFELAASPEDYGKAGRRSFFLDAAGKVRGADKRGAVATPQDPLIAGEKSE